MDMPIRTALHHVDILRRGWYMGMVAPVEIASLPEHRIKNDIVYQAHDHRYQREAKAAAKL